MDNPAGAAPPTVVSTTPANNPAPVASAVEQARINAQADIAAGVDPLARHGNPDQPRIIAGKPNAGQFARQPVGTPPSNVAPAAGQPAPAPGTPPAAPQPPPAAAPAPGAAPGAPPAPGSEAPAPTGEEAPPAGDEAPDPLAVDVPIGEDEFITIQAEDEAGAQQLRDIINDALTGRDAEAISTEARAALAEHEEMRLSADADPVGFTLAMIDNDVERAEQIVTFLLTQPTLWNRMQETLRKLGDPTSFRELAMDARDSRTQAETTARNQVATHRAVQANLAQVQATVDAMLPSTLSAAARAVARRDCLRDLQEHSNRQRLVTLPVQSIPSLLAERLTALGIDPVEAAARAATAGARKGSLPASPRGARAPAPRPTPAPVPAAPKKDGPAFVASAARRKAAAAIPGGGAGAPTPPGTLATFNRGADGKALGIEATLAAHREKLKSGQKTY